MYEYDVIVIGSGPAGLSAAIEAKNNGAKHILIIEREDSLGGILNQCIHTVCSIEGNNNLTGTEYIQILINKVEEMNIKYKLSTMVLELNEDKTIVAVNDEEGIITLKAEAVILAVGCREKPKGEIHIPDSRCAGIFTAGSAQKFVNINGVLPGKKIVIFGSGNIALIMARRLSLEGAEVKAVIEPASYLKGLKSNVESCLNDFHIPLKLNYTVIDIEGIDRITGITIAELDKHKNIIKGTEKYISCDTLLVSAELIPENELLKNLGVKILNSTNGPFVNESFQTKIDGFFICGNSVCIHDSIASINEEGKIAGKSAALYINSKLFLEKGIPIISENGIKYTIPFEINLNNVFETINLKFRVDDLYLHKCVSVYIDNNRIISIDKEEFTPIKMENIFINKNIFMEHAKKITLKIE